MNDSRSSGFPVYNGIWGWWMHLLPKLPAVVLWRKWMGNARCFCTESSGKGLAEECEGELVQLGCSLSQLWMCWVCKALKSDQLGWFKVGISITFAFVLANKCAVFVWLVFSYPIVFYFDCDCIFGNCRMCDCWNFECVSERVEQKVIPFGRCYRFTL